MPNCGMTLTRKIHANFLLMLTAMFCLLTSAVAGAQTTVSPTTVNFGNVVVGTSSAAHTVLFKNTGSASITLTTVSVGSGTPYSLGSSSTCIATHTVAPGGACTAIVTLSPTALGAQPAGTLTIDSTATTGGTQTVALSGTGVNASVLSATSINFGNIPVGETSNAAGFYLTNYALTPITISSISVPAPYAVASGGTCGSTLGAQLNCSILVKFAPTSLGAAPATVTVSTSATNSPLTLPVTGDGVTPTAVTPTSLNFGSVVVGTTSAIKSVTLVNYQVTALTITAITPPANYAVASTT